MARDPSRGSVHLWPQWTKEQRIAEMEEMPTNRLKGALRLAMGNAEICQEEERMEDMDLWDMISDEILEVLRVREYGTPSAE